MSALLPIRYLVRLARIAGLAIILSALLATPVECLCGDPYPSAHALLEFILSPNSIIMTDDGMPGMAMSDHMNHDRTWSSSAPANSSVTINAAETPPEIASGMTPTIRDAAGHLERAGSYAAIGDLLLFLLFALTLRAIAGSAPTWRGLRLQPATPPPRILLSAS